MAAYNAIIKQERPCTRRTKNLYDSADADRRICGSTAGGMKTTTFAVLILNMVATFCQKEDIEIFGRRLDSHAIKNAATIVALYIILFFIGGIAISSIEHLPLLDCLFVFTFYSLNSFTDIRIYQL